MDLELIYREILLAKERIQDNILRTPILYSRPLSALSGARVFLKMESEQFTCSFKARGSLNKVFSLTKQERQRELITASTGNHALGFARACELAGCRGTVYLPEDASKAKIRNLSYYKVNLEFYPGNSLDTELHAREQAAKKGLIWISPYNDIQVIGGQGTIAIEIDEELNKVDHILVTVGGGGLVSGIGTYYKHKRIPCRIVGCQPENSPEMTLSLKEGHIVQLKASKETLSDGSAGGIEPGAITFPICQKVIDDTILVREEEIASALRWFVHSHRKIIEGSAAVAIASLMKEKERFKDSIVVVIICGANIDVNRLKTLI